MACSAFLRFIGFHYIEAIIFLGCVDFRNMRNKGQHLNSLCAVSTLPKGKNKIVVFNIVALDDDKITVAVTRSGKISVCDYELHTDKKGLYFEYGVAGREHIHIDDFEEV